MKEPKLYTMMPAPEGSDLFVCARPLPSEAFGFKGHSGFRVYAVDRTEYQRRTAVEMDARPLHYLRDRHEWEKVAWATLDPEYVEAYKKLIASYGVALSEIVSSNVQLVEVTGVQRGYLCCDSCGFVALDGNLPDGVVDIGVCDSCFAE